MIKEHFRYEVPPGIKSEAMRIDIPRGTTSIVMSGSIHLPHARPEGGIISLIGIRSGDQEGKRRLLCEVTVGRRDQWRLAGDQSDPAQAGSKQAVEWGDSVGFELSWLAVNSIVNLLIDGRPSVDIETPHDLDLGGVLFLGMDEAKRSDYGPMRGMVMEGEVAFEVAEVAPPVDPSTELAQIATDLQRIVARIIAEGERLRS